MARLLKLFRISLIPFALLSVLVLRLLKGRIRLGRLWTHRIGHLAGNVDVHLCEREAGLRPKCVEIWAADNPCNKQLLKMWSRVMHIDRTGFTEIVLKVNRLFDGWKNTEIPNGNLDRDVNNLGERYAPHVSFTDEEEARGRNELRKLGIPAGEKWVCLMVRDNAYLPQLEYHSYRDSDIATYMAAARMLARRGYYVVRMGAKVAKPMPKIRRDYCLIDYGGSDMRSDFMDIYLAAKCEFAISNGTGIDAISTMFRRPICYVNYVPIEYLSTWNKGLAIWKHHEKDGKRMTLAEIYESGAGKFMRTDQFTEAGITLIDNTPEEIKAVVQEMVDGITSDQTDFWKNFPRSVSEYTKQPLHGEIRLRIGKEFLEGYQECYEIPESANLMSYYG